MTNLFLHSCWINWDHIGIRLLNFLIIGPLAMVAVVLAEDAGMWITRKSATPRLPGADSEQIATAQ